CGRESKNGNSAELTYQVGLWLISLSVQLKQPWADGGCNRHLDLSTMLEEIVMGRIMREFATTWEGDRKIWFERDEDELIGTQRAGGVPLPRIRICDLVTKPTNHERYKPPVLWSGEDGIIESHFINGPE